MEQLDFQILLTDNYCFPMKMKKKTNQNSDIDGDMITVNNFFAHFIREISVTKYESDKELIPTFSLSGIYQYSDAKLKKRYCTVKNQSITTTLTEKGELIMAMG